MTSISWLLSGSGSDNREATVRLFGFNTMITAKAERTFIFVDVSNAWNLTLVLNCTLSMCRLVLFTEKTSPWHMLTIIPVSMTTCDAF